MSSKRRYGTKVVQNQVIHCSKMFVSWLQFKQNYLLQLLIYRHNLLIQSISAVLLKYFWNILFV